MLSSQDLKTIFAIGETAAVEFKRCGNGIENDVYETVCSFLNRFGGDIFLGVLDDGSVVGVPEAAAPHLIRNFISTVSNPAMLSPTFYLSPEILHYDGRTIVHIHVPPSAEVHSFKRVIYDRTHDADVKVTATAQIAQMYIRKQEIFTEQKIYPYVEQGDLRLDLLNELKIGVINNAPNHDHPWGRLSELEILKSTRLYGKDKLTGAAGFNLACVMLLGKDDVIGDIAPAYVTDALVRRINMDRYDDREIIQTNLVESYDRLMNFAVKHLPDPFFLEDGVAKSLRGILCRELLANTLIHREFTSSYRAKFVIEKNRMFVENANRAKQQAILSADDFEPNPKNPIIANFFRLIGLADQLGSGVRNLFKYSRFYSGKDPEFVEGDVFRIIVPLDDTYSWDVRTPENTPTMRMEGHKASQQVDGWVPQSENTTQSAESTTQSVGKTDQSTEKTDQSAGKTDQSTEKTDQSTEKTDQSTRKTDQSTRKTDQSTRKTDQSAEKTDQSAEKTDQSAEKTDQSGGTMVQSVQLAENTPQAVDRTSSEGCSTKDSAKEVTHAEKDQIPAGILELIAENAEITQSQMAARMNCKISLVKYYMGNMIKNNIIHRIGSPRKGHWVIDANHH